MMALRLFQVIAVIQRSFNYSYSDILDQWSFVMAHEFFDALPIHSFEVHSSSFEKSYVIYKHHISIRKLGRNGAK